MHKKALVLSIAVAASLIAGVSISGTQDAALQVAIEQGQPGAVAQLAHYYAERNLVDASRAVLIQAVGKGDKEAERLLIEHDVTHGDPKAVTKAITALESLPDDTTALRTRLGLRLADRVLHPELPAVQQRRWAQRAVLLLRPAKQAGDAEALWRVGYLASLGLPRGQDPAAASALMERAAEAGHPAAAYWAARYHFDGVYTPRDVDLGVHFLELAALAGHGNAMRELAAIYAETDPRVSRFWASTAANRAGSLTRIDPNTVPKALRQPGRTPSTPPAPARPEELVTNVGAVSQTPQTEHLPGSVNDAQTRLIESLVSEREALRVERDQLRADLQDWRERYASLLNERLVLAKTAEQANTEGLDAIQLGDYELASERFRTAANAGFAPGLTNLGVLYLNGRGVPVDPVQAKALLKRASDLGDMQASENLARMYQFGLGVNPNSRRAEAWFRKALGQGSQVAAAELSAR